MSLYYLQKLFYELNRNETLQVEFRANQEQVLDAFELTGEEREAGLLGNIGLLYVLGVNGQLLICSQVYRHIYSHDLPSY